IAEGNLNFTLEQEYTGEFSKIKTSLMGISESLNNIIGQINVASQKVSTSSEHVSAGSHTLSQGAVEQASAVEELAAIIGEVSQGVQKNAQGAQKVREITQSVERNILVSNEKMKNMTETIQRINDKSLEVYKISKLIEEIAFQTNILALNAAVEAARAGEAGRGFAVVADEIRKLSDETKNSSMRIMSALNHLAETSAKMTDGIAKVIEIIQLNLEKITEVNTSVISISDDSQKLNSNISLINTAIKEVEQSNQNMVDNMQQMSEAMSVMSNYVENASDNAKSMLKKYEQTTENVGKIEASVGNLVVRLGDSGFMGIQDAKPGNKVSIIALDREGAPDKEYYGQVVRQQG
ncbi:MAG: hypothetical protein K2N82_15725, partial [Lachnospiraceae bacterium]|nr:hypothetical protein [Lachnospiraceae bacterium]